MVSWVSHGCCTHDDKGLFVFSPPLARLIDAFQRLPGIGPKTAQRLAFFVLTQSSANVAEFSQALVEAREKIQPCSICHGLSASDPCEICIDPQRKRTELCVVPDARDVYALERTQVFQGMYQVLGGLISPLEGKGPDSLNLEQLTHRLQGLSVEHEGQDLSSLFPPLEEIILALPPSTEGDTTSLYLNRLLKDTPVKITRIAFGLPVGGDLEYADSMTLSLALQGRHEF